MANQRQANRQDKALARASVNPRSLTLKTSSIEMPVHLRYSRLGAVILAISIMIIANDAPAVTATWTAGDGNYTTASNWTTDPNVPLNNGLSYDVIINGSGTDVTYDAAFSGAVDSLSLGAGVRFITDLASSVFTATITMANDATFRVEDQSTLNLGGGNLDRSSLIVSKGFQGSGGAMLTTSVSSWTGTNGFNIDRTFSADGLGSVLDLSSLTSVERNGGSTSSVLSITATDAGLVDLSGITAFSDNTSGINGDISVTSRDAGSKVDLSNVQTISDVNIEVRDGGDITGQLTSITGRSQLLKRGLDDADGDAVDMIDLSMLVSANNASLIAEDGATLDLGSTSIDQTDLIARKGFQGAGGAMLTTSVSSWVGTNGFNIDREFSADGVGSVLDLSSLTSAERNGGSTSSVLSITATDGGLVDLSGLAAFSDNTSGINGDISITSRDAGSKVDLSNVQSISDVNITVRDGGDITGQLTSITGRSQLLKRGQDDADGDAVDMIDLSMLVSANNASLIAEDGATLDLGSTSIDQTDLIARKGFQGAGGAMLTTSVSSWVGTNGFNIDREFSADGVGSVLDLSSLTSAERNGGSTSSVLSITATDGGLVDLSGITGFSDNTSGINGDISVTSRDAGSKVDLSNVQTISDVNIEVRDGGDITGQLTSITGRSQLLKRGQDDADGDAVDMIDLSMLVSANNASLIAEDGATLDLGSTSIDQTDLIARKGFQGSGGAILTTSVSSWTGTNGFNIDREFSADGMGSVLDLSSLTSVERNGGSTSSVLSITATDGGLVDLSGITGFSDNTSGVNGKLIIEAEDTDSKILLSNVTALEFADVSVDDTSSIDLGNLAQFEDGTIEMKSTDLNANDLHVASSFQLGSTAVVDVAASMGAVVVGPGTPSGAASGSLTVTSGGTLSGTGTVIGTLINQGHIQPGNSPGMLSIMGDFEQDSSAVLGIDIGGTVSGIDFDLLDITGSATLAGDVEVSLFDGYVPTLGDSFTFLEADNGISGIFAGLVCTNCGEVGFQLVYDANFVSLNVVAAPVPLPPAALFLLSGLAGIMIRRRR